MSDVTQVNFLLQNGFSMLALGSAIEVFLACNRVTGETLFVTRTCGFGLSAQSDSSVEVNLDTNLGEDNLLKMDDSILVVCGGTPSHHSVHQETVDFIENAKAAFIVGIGTGGLELAMAGRLDNLKASVHWHSLKQLREKFPRVHFSSDLMSIDDNQGIKIATCRSGTAAMDLFGIVIDQFTGKSLANAIHEYLIKERVGLHGEALARLHLNQAQKLANSALANAIELMESNIEEPLSFDEIAKLSNISKRQLERKFKSELALSPNKYYQLVRLEKAKILLGNSIDSITQIANECGYSSAAHFSTAYRNLYGLTPSEERAMAFSLKLKDNQQDTLK